MQCHFPTYSFFVQFMITDMTTSPKVALLASSTLANNNLKVRSYLSSVLHQNSALLTWSVDK